MAMEGGAADSCGMRAPCRLNSLGTIPPHRELPPTPSATGENRRRLSDMSAAELPSTLFEYQRQAQTDSIASLTEVEINQRQYGSFGERIEDFFQRFDYEPDRRRVVLRMPSPIHDFFLILFAG
ncbi:hypothetical protein FDECE_13350 [Fusarium decemcellulare]|nr:hypothetical protein FDECE_13350 [Fusarium decemcellulare]